MGWRGCQRVGALPPQPPGTAEKEKKNAYGDADAAADDESVWFRTPGQVIEELADTLGMNKLDIALLKQAYQGS